MPLRDTPIGRKITVILLIVTGIAVVVTSGSFLVMGLWEFRQTTRAQLSTLSEVIAGNSTAALVFENQEDAAEILSALRAEQHISAAAVYDREGRLFAKYPEDLREEALPAARGSLGYQFCGFVLSGFQPIVQGRRTVGTVYIELDTAPVLRRWLLSSLGSAFAVIAMALAVVYLLSKRLQKQISEPILSLAATANEIAARREYSLRAVKYGDDEIGQLAVHFNQMLASIQQRDGALREENAERERAEAALRKNEAQLQTIVENLGEGVVVSDLSGRVVHFNRAALRQHGFTSLEQCQRRLPEFADTFQLSTLEGEVLPLNDWPLARVLRGENLNDVELRIQQLGTDWHRVFSYGGTLVHQNDGSPLLAIVTISDITDRKRAEGRAVWLASFPERNPNPILEVELPNYRLHYLNPASLVLFPDLESLGVGHPLLAGLADAARGLSDGATDAVRREVHVNDMWFSQTLNYIPDRKRVRIYSTDITQRVCAEREIHALNLALEQRVQERTSQLESANKELEAFSYSVSHDLRAPLRHIDGYVQMLSKNAGDALSEKSRRYLRIVSESVDEMARLIDDLLAFSRMGRAEMLRMPVDLNLLVKEVVASLQQETSGRNIAWKIVDLPEVEGDPAMLKQVFVNLLSNGVKYTRKREHAQIEIGVSEETTDELVAFVRDNGAGFDMKYVNKLFGVFQRLHRSDEFEGTGVGLASVRRIIHRHGGRIWATGAVDEGATFFFSMNKARKG